MLHRRGAERPEIQRPARVCALGDGPKRPAPASPCLLNAEGARTHPPHVNPLTYERPGRADADRTEGNNNWGVRRQAYAGLFLAQANPSEKKGARAAPPDHAKGRAKGGCPSAARPGEHAEPEEARAPLG
jgi:hypothetical protein